MVYCQLLQPSHGSESSTIPVMQNVSTVVPFTVECHEPVSNLFLFL